jgi:hypothetical protein
MMGLLGILGIVLLSAGWSTSSPVGASPDEPAHVVYAWGVVTGQVLPGRSVEVEPVGNVDGVTQTRVSLPENLYTVLSNSCYKGKQSEPACAVEDAPASQRQVTAETYMTRYSPVYYVFVGGVLRGAVEAGAGVVTAVVLSRFASGLLAFSMVGTSVVMLGKRFGGPQSVVVAAIVVTPQFLFLGASVNPNGFEIGAATLFATTVVSIFADVYDRQAVSTGLGVMAIASGLCLALARPASLVWFVVLALLLFLPVRGRPAVARLPVFASIGLGASLIASVASFLYLNGVRNAGITDQDLTQWQAYPLPLRWILILLKFGDLIRQGYGLLGWADTPMPMLFLITWLVVTVVAVARFTVSRSAGILKMRWSFIYVMVCALAVAVQSDAAGFGWQGRYFVPCIAVGVVLLVPSMADSCVPQKAQRNTALMVFAVVSLLNISAVAISLGRYLYGYTSLFARFEALPVPVPDGTWRSVIGRFAPMDLAAAGQIALMLCAVLCLWGVRANGKGRVPSAAV